jgi:hypothetical protein
MQNLKSSKNQKQDFLAELVAKPECELVLSQTRFEPKPTAVIVVVSRQPIGQLDQVQHVTSEVQGLNAQNETIVAHVQSEALDHLDLSVQIETKHHVNAHLELSYHQLIQPL